MKMMAGPSAQLLRVSTTRLDGGPVFGSTAKERWEPFLGTDRQNRVAIGNYCMLWRHESGWVLVNTGPGDKDPTSLDVAPMRGRSSLLRALRDLGVSPRDISLVVLTHLHSEHAGGATHCTSSGRVLPAFSRARYVVQRAAWEEACQPSERHCHHYRPDDFLPLQENGQVDLVEGRAEIAKGLWVEPAPGPTAGHQIVIADAGSQAMTFLGVLVPTLMHLSPGVVTAYDWDPDETVRSKKTLLRRAEAGSWLVGPVGCDRWLSAEEALSMPLWDRAPKVQDESAPAPRRELEHVAMAV